ncbi:MAG: cupin domain-containing protein [Xanthobacteraceae bacterium]|nr:cupin domain-containing protein [Xanthobacteraceae bacterium]
MKLARAAKQPAQKGAARSFTGVAWQQPIVIGETAEPRHVTRVTFEPGARTVWHLHPVGQVLVATLSAGRFQVEGGPVMAPHQGGSFTLSPGEKHWHEAARDHLFIHLSIQAADRNGAQATWLEPVAEEDYARALA